MAEELQKYLPVLEFILSIRNEQDREQILFLALKDNGMKKIIRQLATNFLHQTYKVENEYQKEALKPYKSAIIKIHKKRSVPETIRQEGYGFLTILVPLVSALLSAAMN